MSRSLALAVLDYSPGWELLLEQAGVPHRALQNVADLSPERFAAVIVNRHLWEEELEGVEAFVREGGGALDTGRFLSRLEPGRFRRGRAGSIFPDDIFETAGPLDLYCRGVRLREGGELNGFAGIEPRGGGALAWLGFDPGRLMSDSRAALHRFPGLDGRYPAERVSRISKGEIEKVVRRMLVRLYAALGLPFIRKRSFPDDAATVLSFRIDSDYGNDAQISALYDLARSAGISMTWFLHAEAHRGRLERFGTFADQEIALHCWRHRTFRDREENRANIGDGLAALQGAGLEARGFAAPNGIWNHGLAQEIDERGFLYSSEFSLACDALPFRPILPQNRRVNKRFYNAFQIPIHPVSVGNLLRAGMNDGQMAEYYRRVIARKAAAGDPLIFYHHPTHERWGVMEELLLEGVRRGGRNLTFAEYAAWWRVREKAEVEGMFVDGHIVVRSRDRDPSVRLEAIGPDGRRGMIKEDGATALADLAPHAGLPQSDGLERPKEIREFSWRLKRRALHDWIIRTSR